MNLDWLSEAWLIEGSIQSIEHEKWICLYDVWRGSVDESNQPDQTMKKTSKKHDPDSSLIPSRVERNERKNLVSETQNLVRESISHCSELIKSITTAYAAYIWIKNISESS